MTTPHYVPKGYTDTTKVSIAFFKETISSSDLLEQGHNPDDKNGITMSKMNRSNTPGTPGHNYCVGMRMPVEGDVVATLKVYAAKIEIRGVRPLEKLTNDVCAILDSYGCKYNVKCKKKLDITLLSLGTAKDVGRLEDTISATITPENYAYKKKKLHFKGAFIHITGINEDKYFQMTIDKFIRQYEGTAVAPKLTLINICSIMSNCKYSVGTKLNIWGVVKHINSAPGFKDAFCIYNNLVSAHCVIVVLKQTISASDEEKLWRDNIETTFAIKNTGAISQSSPNHTLGIAAMNLFLAAIATLGEKVVRK